MTSFKLPNYVPKLNKKILVVDFDKVLLTEHRKSGLSYKEAAQKLDTTPANYSHYLRGRTACSIAMLKKFCKLYKVNLFDKVFNESFAFTSRCKTINLPREITPELGYYVGYLQGDGYLGSDGIRFGFIDEYLSQMKKIKGMTIELFGKRGTVHEVTSKLSKKPYYRLEVKSAVISSFLNVVFGVPRGIKQDLKIPPIIMQNKEVLKHYLAGLYDADGTIPKTPKKAKQLFIDITLKDKEFIKEIKAALQTFGIETLKIYKRCSTSLSKDKPSITWELRLRRKGFILKFLQEISFYHPDKARRAKSVRKLLMDP